MSGPRHASGRSTTPVGLAAGMASSITGVILVVAGTIELIRYTPYSDAGAGPAGLWLAGIGTVAVLVPMLAVIIQVARAAHRKHAAWMQTLTPQERALVMVGEAAVLYAAHVAFRDYNRRTDARLTKSVMGTPEG